MIKYKQLMQDIGYTFQDMKWLEIALTHRSVGSHNNERLEFLGDSILNFIVATELYKRFAAAAEGQLTRMRAHFICEAMLIDFARRFKIGEYIILGDGEKRSGGHQRVSILADAVEAIIGAIFLDATQDLNIVQQIVLSWYDDQFAIFNDKKLQNYKDPKTVLQELLQAKKLALPEYEVIKIEGEQHKQTFYVQCKVTVLLEPIIGVGNSRRKAEQIAAEKVLEVINVSNK